MGRPKLNVQRISVYLTPGILERIDAVAGGHQRSVFIRQAIEKALDQAEKTPPAAAP